MTAYLKLYGERLVELGYTVLPIKPGSKRPDIKDWPRHATTGADVVKWYSNGRAQHGVGINARNTPAIDVDVLDPEVAQAMSDAIDQIFPGVSLMTRTGLAPKFLIPFRSDEPFRKLSSQTYTDGKNDHKVEILGDGQQFVAYAVHPETKRAYEWFDGLSAEGIRSVERAQLSLLIRADAQRVIDAFEILAQRHVAAGLWRAKDVGERSDVRERSGDDPFVDRPPVGKEAHEVEALLARHPNNEADYDHWFKVLAAVHHELGDAGEDIARAWSTESHKHTDEKFELTWNSLGSYSGRQLTLRSVMALDKSANVPPTPHPGGKKGDMVPFLEGSLFAAGFEDTDWLVEDVVPRAQVGVLYGASGSGKTFFALDMACTIHRGLEWRGKHVERADTFYVAAEAGNGIKKRIAAYVQQKGEGPLPWFVDYQPNLALLESAHHIAESVNLRSLAPGLIFVDTLALSHDGDENSSKDMSLVLRHCKILSDATGAVVLLVHHTGKDDSKGMRGSSALYAGSDFVLEISAEGRRHAMFVDKLKDGERGAQFGFTLPAVEVGVTPRGKSITSCYVSEAEPTLRTGLKELVVAAQIFIMDVFKEAIGVAVSMSETELVEAVKEQQKANDHSPSQTQSIKKSIGKMINSGHFCKENERISLPHSTHSVHSDSFE